MMRNFFVSVLGLLLAAGLAAPLQAQSSTPQMYSFTEDPAIEIIAPNVVKLSRDGPKEAVDQIIPPSPDRPKGFHTHILYDFQAHKIYTQVLGDPQPCSVMDYSSPAAPWAFDVISGAAEIMQQLTDSGKVQLKPAGSETVNGIAAKVLEADSPQGTGKIWLAEKGNFPLKLAMIGPDGKQKTMIEVKQLSFAKPPASDFTPPAGCQQIKGAATATGVHANF